MIRKQFILIFTLLLLFSNGYAQLNHSAKIETGFSKYIFRPIQVDPSKNWKEYNLNKQKGIDFNFVKAFDFKSKVFIGVGIGYLNFEGINGASLFSDFEYLPLKTRLTPLVHLKIGYSHIWNQYENGTGTGLT